MLGSPHSPEKAKKLARTIIENGNVSFSSHALEEMGKDDLTTQDALNTIRAGVYDPAEFENGSWRHQVRTQRMAFVIAFRSNTELVVVTAWRLRK